MDRRLVTCIITFGLITPSMWILQGSEKFIMTYFKQMLRKVVLHLMSHLFQKAMTIPAIGMIIGLCGSGIHYVSKTSRTYETEQIHTTANEIRSLYKDVALLSGCYLSPLRLTVQLATESMIFGALAGIIVLSVSGSLPLKEADAILTSGMRMMSFIGFVMIAAAGFGAVLRKTGHVESLNCANECTYNLK